MSIGQLSRLEIGTADSRGELARLELTSDALNRGELARVELLTSGFILLNAGVDRVVDGRDLVTIDVTHTGTTPTAYQWSATDPSVVLAPTGVPAGRQVSFVAPATLDGLTFDVIVTATAPGGVASPAESVRITVLPHNEWTFVGGQFVASSEDEEVVL